LIYSGSWNAHRGWERGRRGGTSCTPSKDFEIFCQKSAIKHEKDDHPGFLTTPCTPSKEFT
jgi:hypothetical protein